MATQYKKIKSIEINNKIDNIKDKYSIECKKKSDNIFYNKVTINSNKGNKVLYFYSYESDCCRILYQIDKKSAIERKKNQPVLFRDFPLIGSENFHFPFFLDGFKFNPLESRNGLYLNGELNNEAIENRKIIGKAIDSSIVFTEYLIKQEIDKRYLLAKSYIPEPPQKYDKCAIEWFIEKQKYWRNQLKELELLKDEESNNNQLKLLKLPQFKEKINMTFFEIIQKFNVTDGILPDKNEFEIWYDIMEKDPLKEVYNIKENTWNFNYLFTEEDLFKKIDNYHTLSNMADNLNTDTGSIADWLNQLYEFLSQNNCTDCFNKFSIIPNKKGDFKQITQIFGNDSANSIPEIINPIYKQIFGKEINDIMIDERIHLKNFEKIIKKKKFKDILNEFSSFLKEDNEENKKQFLCEKLISFDINNDKIKRMFILTKETLPSFRNQVKYQLNNYHNLHNIWREVEEYWYDYHSKIIESKINMDGLLQTLQISNGDNPINWLNSYIKFLKDNSTIVEKRKIFPDQNGNFKFLKDLRYDDSIPEILKDLYNNLIRRIKKNNNEDIKNTLLAKEITCYIGYNRQSSKEIIEKYETLFNSS